MSDKITEFIYDRILQKRPKKMQNKVLYYIRQTESN